MTTYPHGQYSRTQTKLVGTTLHEWVVGYRCPNCGHNIKMLDMGKQVRCGKCRKTIRRTDDGLKLEVS